MANFPFEPPDSDSTSLGSETPVPSGAPAGGSSAIPSAGFEWVEFIMTLSANIGGDPITQLGIQVEHRDPTSLVWSPILVEDINRVTGVAPQVVWSPRSFTLSGDDTWRVSVPSYGAEMRVRAFATAGTPDVNSVVSYAAFRK